jgi:hypothetical protein
MDSRGDRFRGDGSLTRPSRAKLGCCRVQRGAALLLVLLFFWTLPAFAQGCAMCYSSAAASSKEGQKAIDRGIAVLLAPPLGVMTMGVGMAFRYGRKRDQEQNRDDGSPL